ncbi:MAG: hypothetical protein QXE01_05580 [Sulfolobales archaeon]
MWRSEIPRSIYARLYARWRRVRREVEIIASILRRFGARRVIEFGCGLGRHGYLLSRMGYEVVLSDIYDQRFGVAKRLPFARYDLLEGGSIGIFDAGYAVGVITLFEYRDIVRVLRNIGENIAGGGVFIFDYNFTSYVDPERVDIKINGRRYTAILERNSYKPLDSGLIYQYRVRVVDEEGRTVGVEEASYPIYNKEKLFRAIEEAGYRIKDIVWVSWDPVEYIYKPSPREADSAFIAISKE